MHVVVTGADGFIGRHVCLRLVELGSYTVSPILRKTLAGERQAALAVADAVVHLAGVNRPKDPAAFQASNVDFTQVIIDDLEAIGRTTPVIFSSSTQAELSGPYGESKRAAEEVLKEYGHRTGAGVAILRLCNTFGKWARPNYNSAIATFCYNIARGRPVTVHDSSATMRLVHVDDVVDAIVQLLCQGVPGIGQVEVAPVYTSSVGEVASMIQSFADGRRSQSFGRVGSGLTRALYATYVSYLPAEAFSYPLKVITDPRGSFVEMLRTRDSGQFSFFSAYPGVTRGGHYHHTKTEKFVVVQGTARFRFQHLVTKERLELVVRGQEARVVETVPGWAHDVTNMGEDNLIVLLWANEIFDPERPDTIAAAVDV